MDCFFKDGSDGKPEHFVGRELVSVSLEQAQMVYLFACSAAENSSRDLVDGAIHVARSNVMAWAPFIHLGC